MDIPYRIINVDSPRRFRYLELRLRYLPPFYSCLIPSAPDQRIPVSHVHKKACVPSYFSKCLDVSYLRQIIRPNLKFYKFYFTSYYKKIKVLY